MDGAPPSLDARLLKLAEEVNNTSMAGSSETPKTPTEGAWLALLEDEDDDGDGIDEPPSAKPSRQPQQSGTKKQKAKTQSSHSNAQRIVAFWESLMNADNSGAPHSIPSMGCQAPAVDGGRKVPSNNKQADKGVPLGSASPMKQKRESSAPNTQHQRISSEPTSFLFGSMLQCGSIDTTTISKMEEDFSKGIERFAERVDSPCRMMQPHSQYHYDRPFTSGTGVSSTASNIEHLQALDSVQSEEDSGILEKNSSDLISELKDQIPVLRERNGGDFKASKYKMALDQAPRVDPPMEVHFLDNSNRYDESMAQEAPLSPSKRFPENTSQGHLSPCQIVRSSSMPEQKVTENSSQFQQQRESTIAKKAHALCNADSPAKTAKTENTTLEATAQDENDGVVEHPSQQQQRQTSSRSNKQNQKPPIETIEAVTEGGEVTDAIMNGISSLTTEGDFNHAQMLHKNRELVARNHHQISDFRDPVSKTCVPPMLVKRFNAFKNIKITKSMSSTQSANTQNFSVFPNGRFAEYVADNGEGKFIYEYEFGKHAYVAFFRRGKTAAESIRLYEHQTPPVFPTLPHELVVRIDASTVSSTDCQVRRGDFWGERCGNSLNLPIVPGVSFAGTVHQLSAASDYHQRATGLKRGDRVISLVQVGANSRHLCIASDKLVKVPEEISDPCAIACLPEIYLSAFQALHFGQKNGARYRKTSLVGKTLLVLGGATTIGRALIEVAKAAGCKNIYATGKDKQFDAISSCGGAPLGRDPHQWASILSRRVDIVVGNDNTVGTSEIREEHMHLLAKNGRAVVLTAPNNEHRQVVNLDDLAELRSNTGRTLVHYNVFDAWDTDLKQGKRDLTHLMKLLADGLIRPKILERIPLNRVAKAQDLLEGKKMNGFVICEPWILGRKKNEVLTDMDGVQVYAESASKSTGIESPEKKSQHVAGAGGGGGAAAATPAP